MPALISQTCNSDLKTMRQVAKLFGIGLPCLYTELVRRDTFKHLPSREYIPRREQVEAGLFVVDRHGYNKPDTNISREYLRVRVTPKGVKWLEEIIHEMAENQSHQTRIDLE